MKWYNNSRILRKYFALAVIYLIISLTFFTAHVMAVLNYDISGDNDVSGFARADGDIIKINVNADSNVSFAVGQNTADYTEIPLDGCTINNATNEVSCLYFFESSDINTNIQNIPFVLKQQSGNPLTKAGNLYIDSMAPVVTTFTEKKDGNGINFTYNIVDYLASTSEDSANKCIGSGIGYIEIDVQGKPVFTKDITTQNCTISGEYYANFKNTYNEQVRYNILVRDRAGNTYRSTPVEISGDFRAPEIANTFQIMQDDKELTTLSSMAQVQADVVVYIEDSSLNESNVYGDLSSLNLNSAVNIPYKNISASCALESGNTFKCIFSDIKLKPNTADLNITITATDNDGNTATKTITKTIELKDNAGKVLYIGPSKNHCTTDLTQCYLQSGKQLLQAELDATSSYNRSVIYLGIDSDKKFAICKLSDVWTCIGLYDISNDTSSINVFMAESYDDFGNMINSDLERRVIIDDVKPNLTEINFTNTNNNNNCSVAGDTLTFNIMAKEASPGLKVYLNTSAFTTQDMQTGQCDIVNGDEWECTLAVKDFASTPTSVTQDIILEDLAGNKLPIKHRFDVCKGVSTSMPNVIYGVTVDGKNPEVDRRTASKISVKTYVPIKLNVQNGATLMYLTIDRCIAPGMDGLDVMGTGHYFMPSYGNNPTLVLYVGHNNAQLTEKTQSINCTLTARVKIGPTVFLQEERQDFTINIDTYDNPLGTIDNATSDDIYDTSANLVKLDKKISDWNTVGKSLGTICSIAETVGKINTVLQAVKTVVYGVLMVVQIYPAAYNTAQKVWKVVNGALQLVHGLVTRYVWPPGIIPGKGGMSFGTVVKWMCLLYTCKHYDVGTYFQLVGDIVARVNPANQPKTQEYGQDKTQGDDKATYTDPKTGKTVTGVYRDADGKMVTSDGQYLAPGKDNQLVLADSEGKPVDKNGKLLDANGQPTKAKTTNPTYGTPVDVPYGAKSVTNRVGTTTDGLDLSKISQEEYDMMAGEIGPEAADVYVKDMGYLNTKPIFQTLSFPPTVSQNAVNAQQEMLIDALNGHSWVIDPYRSVHYDGLCIPAYIYNLKKERQIECMYLSCLEGQNGLAVPKIMCDGNYKVNKCLYLDSAEYVIGGSNWWRAFGKGLWDAFENTALSTAINIGYKQLCKNDYSLPKTLKDIKNANLAGNGWKSVVCGVAGSAFALREIADAFKNPFVMAPTTISKSSGDVDYCEGLDYKTIYADSGEGK